VRAGDLIAVPDSTRHWFDMGPEPSFVAIRFFTEPDGWVGHFTGTDIARKFPRYEPGKPDEAGRSSPTSKAPPAASPSSRTCCFPTRAGAARVRARAWHEPEVRRWLDAVAPRMAHLAATTSSWRTLQGWIDRTASTPR
jgi:hypothetical protein